MTVNIQDVLQKALMKEANEVFDGIIFEELTRMSYETKQATLDGECHACGRDLEEVSGTSLWPNRDDLAPKRFLICWPCSAWVGLDDDGHPKGYPAREHIRELRKMVLDTWTTLCGMGAMSWDKADSFRKWLRETHGFDTADIGWLDEEQLRLLLRVLDKSLIPDTPAIDALFK